MAKELQKEVEKRSQRKPLGQMVNSVLMDGNKNDLKPELKTETYRELPVLNCPNG